jgi:AraC-like DNA-binding protein
VLLVYREPGQSVEKKLPMAGDDKAAFSVTRPGITDGFDYAVEAGPLRSEWFHVIAADPVDLTEGSSVVVTAPEYARAVLPVKTLLGFGEFEGLVRSTVAVDLKFNRKAESASLEWKAASKPVGYIPVPLAVAADGLSASAKLPLREDGSLHLVLTGDHGIRTDFSVAVRATKDAAPAFDNVVGVTDQALEVRPGEKIPIEFALSDDFAVVRAQLEYALGNPQAIPKVEPVPHLLGANSPRASAKTIFNLADKARNGETLYLRIRTFDNRTIPEEKLLPQETVYPPTGWVTLKLNESARPLAEQQIFGQRDRIKAKLQTAADALADGARETARVQEEAAGKATLADDQQARLNNAAEKARDAQQALTEAARQAGLTPGLREVANEARKIADDPVQAAGVATRKANNEPKADARGSQLAAAKDDFERAADQTKKLIERNDSLAKARLAPRPFEELATEEGKLAAEAKDAADRPGQTEPLADQQKKLEADLAAAVANTPALKDAAGDHANATARKLADEAAKLAADYEALKEARAASEKASEEKRNASFAERQKKLAAEAAGLDDKTQTAGRVAGADPLDRKPFEKAAEALEKNSPLVAMTEQEKAARELDKLAAAMEQATIARGDAKDAAKQLAKWQGDLKRRVSEYTKNDSFDKLPPHVQTRIRQEEAALAGSVAGLSMPPNDAATAKAKADAVDKLAKAEKALEGQGQDPKKAMQAASDSLAELSKKLPDRSQRLKSARAELNRILDEQAGLTRQAESAVRTADKSGATPEARDALAKKLATAARNQDELAKRVKSLDVPGLESRKQKAAEAADRAGDDLKAGLPQDIPASQKDLGRQLDRLKQAIDGQTPADELADILARKQRELATEFAKAGGAPLPQDLEKLQRLQREINKELSSLSAPEAPGLANEAKDASLDVEDALRNPNDVDELKKKTKDAADALDRLADRMGGAESEAGRVDRLQKNRQRAADNARQLAGKPLEGGAKSEEAAKAARQDLEELEQTRVGAAQAAKQKAMEELNKVAKSSGPDRQTAQQQAAANALAELVKQMKQNGDRSASKPRPGTDPSSGADSKDAAGLPTAQKAAAARKLAREQRELRNDLSRASEQAGKNRPAGDPSRLDELAKQQEQLAKDAGKLAKESGGTGAGEPAQKAAEAAEKAASQLAAGGPAAAQQSAEQAAKDLNKAASAGAGSESGQKAAALAEKQTALARQIGAEATDANAAGAMQAQQEKELAGRAGKLADGLANAAGKPEAGEKAGTFKAAADAARDAQRQLDRAAGEAAAGRPTSTAEARKAADSAVQKARDLTAKAAGGQPGGQNGKPGSGGEAGDGAKAALDAVAKADQAMKQAREELGKGNAAGAKGQMDKAEKALNDAASKLNPDSGKGGEPVPGGGFGGQNPGGNDGSAQAPVSPADLSPDLQKYAGKPWGDLPGEIQQRIIQDLRAKYGEDYARVIKLYFTEIANRK